MTTVVEEVFEAQELESAHLALFLPDDRDAKFTRLQRQTPSDMKFQQLYTDNTQFSDVYSGLSKTVLPQRLLEVTTLLSDQNVRV